MARTDDVINLAGHRLYTGAADPIREAGTTTSSPARSSWVRAFSTAASVAIAAAMAMAHFGLRGRRIIAVVVHAGRLEGA